MSSPSTAFLSYFQRELDYLNQAGQSFAKKHPKIAAHLALPDGSPQDPHVARLIESFAFLTAQLHQKVDDQFPKAAASLLHVLYPQFTQPLPSIGIMKFEYDPTRVGVHGSYTIARGTEMYTYDDAQNVIRFQSGYPVTLYPLHVNSADTVPLSTLAFEGKQDRAPYYLRISLSITSDAFDVTHLNDLVFFLKGDRLTTAHLFQALFQEAHTPLFYQHEDGRIHRIPDACVSPMGFQIDEQLCPSPHYTHPAYQLLLEYFHAPEKHLFIKLTGLSRIEHVKGRRTLNLLMPITDEKIIANLTITKDHFVLGCTPIINIFEKTTDPFQLTHEKNEYKLIPDQRGEFAFEVHSIQDVYGTRKDGSTQSYAPYHAFQYHHSRDRVWSHRREPSPHYVGSDVYLSLMDHHLNPNTTDYETVYARVLCTNRALANAVSEGDLLYHDGGLPVTRMTCISKPNMPSYVMMEGDMLWKMVAQLSIHHLGYNDPAVSLSVLKETLMLHANMSYTLTGGQIDAITDFETHEVVRRIPRYSNDQAWCGYLKGTGVTLTVDESLDPSGMSFILARVLWHFLAMNVRIDSFVELTLVSRQRDTAWCTLPPLNGYQNLL